VNAVDRWGATPLDDALRGNHPKIISFLQAQGGQAHKEKLPSVTTPGENPKG